MTKTHKAVLSTLAVLCLLFMGSGVAQAQLCVARAISPGMVRAEGITEVVASIELKCGQPSTDTFGFNEVPPRIDIAVELNARITNEINDTRVVAVLLDNDTDGLAYKSRAIDLRGNTLTDTVGNPVNTDDGDNIMNVVFMGVTADGTAAGDGGKLSEDSTTILWSGLATGQVGGAGFATVTSTEDLNLGTGEHGFSLIIAGIRANASALGDGEDITANVMVNGSPVGNPLKVADVSTGLAIKAKAAEGLQCTDGDAMATITIQEGYKAGIMSGVQKVTGVDAVPADETAGIEEVKLVTAVTAVLGDTVLVTFMGIPEGVSVMVPDAVGLADDVSGTSANEMTESFRLVLMTEGRDLGIDGKVVDGVATVMLSAAGAGSVVYHIYDASPTVDANEWAKLPVTFQWEAGGDMPALGSSYVNVSFNPVSAVGEDTFAESDSRVPRFSATSGDPIMVLKIDDCTTTLLFPYVANVGGFDTGLVISNTSEEAGSCTITYSGANAPEPQTTQAIAGGAQWIRLASMISSEFQGYLTAACGFRDAHGFAYISNGYAGGEATLAQGYLAVCTAGNSCKHP